MFAGAGISRNSGLPIANDLRDKIFEALKIPAGTRKLLVSTPLPFELIIETIAQCSNPVPLYQIFQAGLPCLFHNLTAQLARSGDLVGIVTTNFDSLFEEALLSASVPFERIWQEDKFSSWKARAHPLPLLKIHGSAHDETSLGITIRRVASQRGVAARESALQQAFMFTSADVILVVGYSGSDRFDINPILSRIASSAPPIVLVAHQSGAGSSATIETLLGNTSAGPFSLFDGIRITCDTSVLVAQIAAPYRSLPLPPHTSNWCEHVIEWFRESTETHGASFRAYMIGALLRAAARPHDARYWFRKATKLPAGQQLKIDILLSLARCVRDIGKDLNAARGAASNALRLSNTTKNIRGTISSLIELGVISADERKFVSALRYYLRAEKLAKKYHEAEKRGIALGNAAIVRKNIGGTRRLRRALRDYAVALDIARDLGDKRSEGRTLGNIGIAYSILGNPDQAISQFRLAGDVAKELGDVYHEAIWLVGEAHDTFPTNAARAIELTLQARSMFSPLSAARVKDCDEHLRRFGYHS
ncbi:SIR2 family protein [Pleomorphomonas sp. T1.2MG-36]|uniref:SIR2 family protein n=1 Tax=Pleomorphomonas sp. T1.2MG-36 TaxID=3041167 RepID=UPI0025411C82|nr:SIR2 family protein [Pleomorphomonas sp. T1.2MG-36]